MVILPDIAGGPRGRGFSRESRAITLDKGLSCHSFASFVTKLMRWLRSLSKQNLHILKLEL